MIATLLLSTLLTGYPPTPGNGSFRTIEAIEYARPAGTPLLLDLRVPDGAGPHPVILYLHSGAWITGDRTGGAAIRQASRGYAVASIDYRLAPRSTWPAQLDDVKSAIRWVRANAAQYGLDPDRIAVFGSSAGGHIAANLGTNPDPDTRVRAIVDMYGPTDLLKIDEQKLPCANPLDGNASWMPPSLLIGCPIQQCREKTELANPIRFVTPDDPPFLILHGLLDCLVPAQQSVSLHEALQTAGVSSRLILIPNGEHGGDAFDEQQYKQAISDFLDEHVRGPLVPARRRSAGR